MTARQLANDSVDQLSASDQRKAPWRDSRERLVISHANLKRQDWQMMLRGNPVNALTATEMHPLEIALFIRQGFIV